MGYPDQSERCGDRVRDAIVTHCLSQLGMLKNNSNFKS
jgi:hypothetical protein